MKNNYFFIHGGPGFTSKPEEIILTPLLKADTHIFFWNELSPLRGATDLSGFFNKNLEHLIRELEKEIKVKGEITPIFFSFGLQYLFHLPETLTNQFKKIILLSPVMDLTKLDLNIFQIALSDLKQSNSDNYTKLKILISELGNTFDQKKEEAFLVAVTAPTLFTNYFNSEKIMMSYFGYLTGEFAFSIESFFAIRRSIPAQVNTKILKTPTIALFGEADPITTYSDQYPQISMTFKNLQTKQFRGHKHFLHLEDPSILFNCFIT